MVRTSADDTDGKVDDLLASRRFLAFDSEMPMELQVDRPELPMERRQLKVNRRVISSKRRSSSAVILKRVRYPEEG